MAYSSQQMQTNQLTNQNSKQEHAAGAKSEEILGFSLVAKVAPCLGTNHTTLKKGNNENAYSFRYLSENYCIVYVSRDQFNCSFTFCLIQTQNRSIVISCTCFFGKYAFHPTILAPGRTNLSKYAFHCLSNFTYLPEIENWIQGRL